MEKSIQCVCLECPADNKCETCPFNKECDWPWITKLWNKTPNLSPCLPGWVKPYIRSNRVITITKNDFCVFNAAVRKDYVTVNEIAVDESCRGQGIAKKLLQSLMDEYDKDIFARCIKDSSAEAFWKHIGAMKIGEEPSKKSIVCLYLLKNEHKKEQKEDLW